MTRYDTLCELYGKARAAADARRDRCAAVVEKLRERIRAHLDAPDDAVGFRSLEVESDDAVAVPLADALTMSEDGTWNAGIQITLRDAAKPDAPFMIFFGVRMREENGRLVLSLSDDDPGRTVQPDDDAVLDEIAAEAHRRLEGWLAENLDRALGAPGKPEHYGVYL